MNSDEQYVGDLVFFHFLWDNGIECTQFVSINACTQIESENIFKFCLRFRFFVVLKLSCTCSYVAIRHRS